MVKKKHIHEDNIKQIENLPSYPIINQDGSPVMIKRIYPGWYIRDNQRFFERFFNIPKNLKDRKSYFIHAPENQKPLDAILKLMNKGKAKDLKEAVKIYLEGYEKYKKYEANSAPVKESVDGDGKPNIPL